MSQGLEGRLRYEAKVKLDTLTNVYAGDVVELLDERDAELTALRARLAEAERERDFDLAWLCRFEEATGTHAISAYQAREIASYVRRLQADANEVVKALAEVGRGTEWRDGSETDRVYSWHEISRLRCALLGVPYTSQPVHVPSPVAESGERPERPPMLLARIGCGPGVVDWLFPIHDGNWMGVSQTGIWNRHEIRDIDRELSDPAALAIYDRESAAVAESGGGE